MIPKLKEVNKYDPKDLETPEEYYEEIFGEDFNEERLFYLLGWGVLRLEREIEYDDEGEELGNYWTASTSEWANGYDHEYSAQTRIDAMKGLAVLWYLGASTYEGYIQGLVETKLNKQREEIKQLQEDMQDMIRTTREKVEQC